MGMIKRESVKAALHGPNREFAYGNDAYFCPINEEWGFKYFEQKEICEITYEAQKKAHEFGLAPAVGLRYNMRDKFGDLVYGYITESIVELGGERYGQFGEYDVESNWWQYDDAKQLLYGLRKLFNRHWFDFHQDNCGWLKNGQLVCIDFSICV